MCDICLHNPCVPRCPNYSPAKSDIYCEICDEPILSGEPYIENHKQECIHLDCANQSDSAWLIRWLEYPILV